MSRCGRRRVTDPAEPVFLHAPEAAISVLDADLRPVECRNQLVEYLAAGAKPRAEWRIGTEHEKFAFRLSDHRPVPYTGPGGIAQLLKRLHDRFGWEPSVEEGHIIGLVAPPEIGGAITLEPGGQVELSGAPLKSLHQTCDEVHTHLTQLREVGTELGIGFLGLGFAPTWSLAEVPRMPKGRYDIMRRYMAKVGKLGLDMMHRSCTVQVNLDYSSEADMVKKLRVGLALQPVVTALFANSPFTEGRPNGYLSYRARVWRDTDRDRTGLLPFVFEDGMGFERYVDYALDVPMYFVHRAGRYVDVAGASFRDFLDGRLDRLAGERPNMGDWANHLTTLFPEARAKRFIEMRGADGGPWRGLCALPALWVGLIYDGAALDAAWELARGWTAEERDRLREDVAVSALRARIGGRQVREIASDLLEIARSGLRARAELDSFGDNEEHFLTAVEAVVEEGTTHAEELLAKYHNAWAGNAERVFDEYAY
jgi:glutamate--cysteine ligase